MKRLEAIELPAEEIAHQKALMREFAAIENRPHTYCVVTYGCQMNAHDSEKLAGMLQEMGMTEAESRETADFVIFNTCCVRDNAQRRALGNVTWLKELKKTRPEMMVAVCGCMMQQKGMGEQILRQYPFVDVAFGTHNLYRFAQLMLQAVKNRRRVVEVIQEDEGSIPENLPVRRSSPHHAYITIMYGCNNFCSYCIVPYVRGRERSRASARIIEEARQLKEEGVKEIMLLGQNVNSYGLDVEGELSRHRAHPFHDLASQGYLRRADRRDRKIKAHLPCAAPARAARQQPRARVHEPQVYARAVSRPRRGHPRKDSGYEPDDRPDRRLSGRDGGGV